jgi:Flp pilus assembly pilin Flp
MIWKLLIQLWNDQAGAVLSTEYLMLGSIVAAGGTAGMTQLRDAVTEDFREFGATARQIRQSYMPPPASYSAAAATRMTTPGYPVVGMPSGYPQQPNQYSQIGMP